MIKMKKILLLMFSLAALGCNNWLDGAKPKEFTEEEELFSRETGFKEALTGAYQNMNFTAGGSHSTTSTNLRNATAMSEEEAC